MTERMVTFTPERMLREWKLRKGLMCESLDTGTAVVRHDMAAPEERMESEIRSWYSRLLVSAPVRQVPVRNLTGAVAEISRPADNMLRLRLPSEGYRLVEVKLRDWTVAVSVFHSPGSLFERRQGDLLLRATPGHPGVVDRGDGIIEIYGLDPLPSAGQTAALTAAQPDLAARLERLMMTAWPADGNYTLDSVLLDTI